MSAYRTPPALVLIDVQKAIDDPRWCRYGPRNHPGAEQRMAQLLAAWRERQLPVYHVRHDSTEPGSSYCPGQPGHEFKREVAPTTKETIVAKQTNNAFVGTNFERTLREAGHTTLVVAGVITNNSVEATVRMAGNLGFDTYLVEDACFTFPRPDFAGRLRNADEVHAMSLANMEGEYCTVISARDALFQLD